MGRQVSRQQFVGEGVGDGGGAAGHAELGEDVLDVVLGSAPADEQGLADVGVGGAVGEQLQYLKLAGAQGWQGGRRTGALRVVPGAGRGAGLQGGHARRVQAVLAGQVREGADPG